MSRFPLAAALLAGTALALGCSGTDCALGVAPRCVAAASGGPLHIELRFLTGNGSQAPTAAQRMAFDNVVARLERIVTRGPGGARISTEAGTCGPNSPAIHETVESLLILVRIETIDGSGLAVGQGSSCWIRSDSYHPIISLVRLDRADLGWLGTGGLLESVILHEMLHALGFGNVWGPDFFDYLVNPSKPGSGGVDTHFAGASAILGFDEIGGEGYPRHKVPVENTGQAQADVHWRGSVLSGELMQPFLRQGAVPRLSRLTLRSLQDLGYEIDLSQAEQYTLPGAPVPGADVVQGGGGGGAVRYDAATGIAVRVVDRAGRIVRVIQP